MFHRRGVHAIVDGQFGSTGKGAYAAYIAKKHGYYFEVVVTNSGPNSGHTFYGPNDEKIVLKQLPTLAVASHLFHKKNPAIYLSAGAVIDPEILNAEAAQYPGLAVFVSRRAAIVRPEDRDAECQGSIAAVAGTRMGVGAAIARKIMREEDAIVGNAKIQWAPNIYLCQHDPSWENVRIGLEVSQGYSLGLNSTFYPKVTSRECTVMQGLTDARIPAQRLVSVGMAIRTFPIRVGNVDGHSSGDYYPDQVETTWENIGVAPELTTVTKRVRRVFTFSDQQFCEALLANMPTDIFVNFMNYLKTKEERLGFAAMIRNTVADTLNYRPGLLFGFGPKVTDIRESIDE